jgi:V-type H+-transporting ATPase subunit G
VQRLKDARAEANREVEEYKRQKEQEYKAFERKVRFQYLEPVHKLTLCLTLQHAGSTQNSQSQVDKETDAKIAAIKSAYEGRKDAVVQLLLDRVVLVKPELHRNLKKAES